MLVSFKRRVPLWINLQLQDAAGENTLGKETHDNLLKSIVIFKEG
jgi:hypothetical protein